MRFFTLTTLAVAILPVAFGFDWDDVCPPLSAPWPDKQCQCLNILGQVVPFKSGCTATLKRGAFGIKYCKGECTGPSGLPPIKKNKRDMFYLEDGTIAPCPRGTISCPVSAPVEKPKSRKRANGHHDGPTPARKVDPFKDQYECIDPKYDLDNCGGCAASGQGQSCLSIPGVRGTACMEGKCAIFSCSTGYTLVATKSEADDNVIVNTCVAKET